jgi:hypothetical protein
MAKQQRRIVFFLGAGASLGAGADARVQGGGHIPIPTQATFWETFLRLSRDKRNKRDIECFLFRYFLGYAKAPGRANAADRRRQLKAIDVEEVFTFLSERNNAPGVSRQLRTHTNKVWNALLAEVGQVFRRFDANKRTRSTYRTFKRRHVGRAIQLYRLTTTLFSKDHCRLILAGIMKK